MKLYFAKDAIADNVIDWFCAPTDGAAIRSAVPIFSRMRPINDVEFYYVADLASDGTVQVAHAVPKLVSKDSYKFPETISDPIGDPSDSPETVVKKFRQKISDVVSHDSAAEAARDLVEE